MRPDRMVIRNFREGAKRIRSLLCKVIPNFLRAVFVMSHDKVRVISQDGAREHSVSMQLNRATETFCDRISEFRVEPERRVFEFRFCVAKELPQFIARWLNTFSSEVQITQVFQLLLADIRRSTSARVVGKPVSVTGEDQVNRLNHATKVYWRFRQDALHRFIRGNDRTYSSKSSHLNRDDIFRPRRKSLAPSRKKS